MKVKELMTRSVNCCLPEDTLNHAAHIMWKNDCGCVPIVDEAGFIRGMITDRDICMAAHLQGKPLVEILVAEAMAGDVHACRESDTVEVAEMMMRQNRVRRLPVTDDTGYLKGVLSLQDLARRATPQSSRQGGALSADSVVQTFASIGQPWGMLEQAAE